ncbi:MAG: DUF1659 domain-containing protein [Ignavibacteriales bacterium]
MAVQANPIASEALIRVENGVSSSGSTVYASRRLSGIKPAAANEDVHAVAQSLGSLQSKTVAGIHRNNDLELVETP